MNNEIGRKITSLTLMTIMLASAFAGYAPSVLPQAAAANANLYVSAENSQFQNYFAGPQVIEVVVIDSDIKDTDKGKGEPDVTVNGKKLRMVQNTDGNWYGYFADKTESLKADAIAAAIGSQGVGKGLDFGTFCSSATTFVGGDATFFSDTSGVAFPATLSTGTQSGDISGGTISATCAGSTVTNNGTSSLTNANNVVREFKKVNKGSGSTVLVGQVGLNATSNQVNGGNSLSSTTATTSSRIDGVINAQWPFVQLYTLTTGGNVIVQYNKGGGVQKTTLTFDTIPKSLIGQSLDRSNYPQNSQVHITMTDPQLNIDPTDEDSWQYGTLATNRTMFYELFDENGIRDADGLQSNTIAGNLTNLMFEKNGLVKLVKDAQSSGTNVVQIQDNDDSRITGVDGATERGTISAASQPVEFTETGPNTGIFGTYDEQDVSALKVSSTALRGTSATIDYNDKTNSIVVANDFGTITFDKSTLGGEWNSGEEIAVTLKDQDQNLNSRSDEDLDLFASNVTMPAVKIGSPLTLSGVGTTGVAIGTSNAASGTTGMGSTSVDTYSDRVKITTAAKTTTSLILINVTTANTMDQLSNLIRNGSSVNGGTGNAMFNYFSYDLRSINHNGLSDSATLSRILIGNASSPKSLILNATTSTDFSISKFQNIIDMGKATYYKTSTGLAGANFTDSAIGGTGAVIIGFVITTTSADRTLDANTYPITADFLRFGINNDGTAASDRFNDAIYRFELEETGDNTAAFAGTLEYIMLNQLNVNSTATYKSISPINSKVVMIVGEDLTDEDSVRANFLDLGADGTLTQIADQVEAPTHSGVASFDSSNYKVGDTVTITVQDQDLNTDTDTIDIYTTVSTADYAVDTVGKASYGLNSQSLPRGLLLDVTFDDERWMNSTKAGTGTVKCTDASTAAGGLSNTGFTLVETGSATGTFTGTFAIPSVYCARSTGTGVTSTVQGTDIAIDYEDFRDASGEIVEVGDTAGVRSNTGSVSLDRTVYPLPWGELADITGGTTGSSAANGKDVFPIHKTGLTGNVNTVGETLGNGDITLHIQVNDPDFNTSATGEDKINVAGDVASHGPVKVVVSRGSSSMVLATAGFSAASGNTGKITVATDAATNTGVTGTGAVTRELGPITETTPDSGIFEFDLTVKFTDGPASSTCPTTDNYVSANNSTRYTSSLARFSTAASSSNKYCLLQGDIITVTYRDPADSSGQPNTVTDSATFDLRNGALQSDKSVYIIGSDAIITLIEPDFDRDNDTAETYDLDLIEWDSDAATVTMGNLGANAAAFDPEPSDLRETGDSTGIFQSVIEIPSQLGTTNNKLERGEEIVLEYTDWGPSGADFVGQENEDVNLTIFTSNFGATVELDQKVYSWTDKVYITIIAPDHNFDSNLVDTIGDTDDDPVKVATRGHKLDKYHLTESGVDTGIFTGEVILTGFAHDADGDASTGTSGNDAPNFTGISSTVTTSTGLGPTNGFLQADDDDGLTVSFEFSQDETVVGSALIRWNIGEVSWLEASYPASGTGVVRIIDPDLNLHPEAIDNFGANVWSDSDAGGIDLTVTETNEASGIFEGTVYFTTTDASSGHRLRVAEGDTVTAEYQDNTLPSPYTRSDELDITGTAFIGTVVPPLERAPASNARVVDAFGNSLDSVSVDQQVQVTADLVNGQDREQAFAYLVQIQDENGVTVSLAWITGSLSAGQSFSPALSWIPTAAGTYTATVFVWESVDNPTALSPPVSVDITVS